MKKKIIALFMLTFVASSAIVFATEEEGYANKPSYWLPDGTYVEYPTTGEPIFYSPGVKPSPTPNIAPVIQCIKEAPPIKIVPIFDEAGNLIENKTEVASDPEVLKLAGYDPNQCETDPAKLEDQKVYKTLEIAPTYRANTALPSVATPAPTLQSKVKISNIKTKKIKNVLMTPARDTLKDFGFKVKWDKKRKILTATKGTQTLEFYQNSKLVKVNKKQIKRLSAFTKNDNGAIMIPLDFITKEIDGSIK